MEGYLLHITPRSRWRPQDEVYVTDSLQHEGFIHCSTPEQVLLPANALFRGQADLIVLIIDPRRVLAPLVFEDCYDSGMAFPHLYGPLNTDAVLATAALLAEPSGEFLTRPALPPWPPAPRA